MDINVHTKRDEILRYAKGVVEKEVEGVKQLVDHIDDDYIEAIRLILGCNGKVVVLGLGKSGHVGKKIAASFASTGTPAFFVHGDETLHGDLGMIEDKDVVIVLTNSGETREIRHGYPTLKQIGCKIISITAHLDCSVAKQSDVHLCIGKLIEADHLNLAPTTSATATLVLGDALALTVSYLKNFTKEKFALFHPGGSLGKGLTGKEI